MAVEHRRIRYEGRVQGVGFRATTRTLATGYAVSGTVRNLPDGDVEVDVWGQPEELDRFHEAIVSEFRPNIRGMAVEQASAEGAPPAGFSIRY